MISNDVQDSKLRMGWLDISCECEMELGMLNGWKMID